MRVRVRAEGGSAVQEVSGGLSDLVDDACNTTEFRHHDVVSTAVDTILPEEGSKLI